MNTPRSKQPKRYGSVRASRKDIEKTSGSYLQGLPRQTPHAALLGELVAYWSHVEENMIEFLGLLLGDRELPTRQIFRSIRSERTRIELLTALLEEAAINRSKGSEYDEIIRSFKSLNTARNKYVHGLWSIDDGSGRVILSEATADEFAFLEQREVTEKELARKLKEMEGLWIDIFRLTHPEQAESVLGPKKTNAP